jgi:acyl-CoA thioesterase II
VADVYLAREVSSTGWLLYTRESTPVGAGISYVRDSVHTEEAELIASFARW